MSRSMTRILLIIVACVALVALAITAKAGATGANPAAWMVSDSGALGPLSGLPAADSTTTTGGALSPRDADNDGDADMAAGAESAQDDEQSSEQEQEQELSGVVASIDAAHSAFTLNTASGAVAVSVTGATQYEDGLSGLASLRAGASVTVKGAAHGVGRTLAAEVKGSSDASATDGADASGADSGQ